MRNTKFSPYNEVINGRIWPLVPIAFGIGIGIADKYAMMAIGAPHWLWFFLLIVLMPLDWRLHRILFLLVLILMGFLRLSYEYQSTPTQLMTNRYYGSIEGQIVMIDQSQSQKTRLTLDQVELDGRPVGGRIRISLHGEYDPTRIKPGAIIQTTGHLSPPAGPAEPGGYDFRKRAWADGISGFGYTRLPTIIADPENLNWHAHLLNFRLEQAEKYRSIMGDRIGGFAAAIFIGDRSEIDADLVKDMRQTNLAHLLAISGMHMGTVAGLLFFGSRKIFALLPFTKDIWSMRITLLISIGLTSAYWILSGMAYSATRAYLMAMLLFGALYFGRRALSLRSVALVASGILIFDPMALGDVGFQMSFAATTALIAIFERIHLERLPVHPALKWSLILLMTSFIAGLATAPFGAYHFNTIPKYGLLANFLAVPVMTFVVMPAGILSVLGAPLGLDKIALPIVEWGLIWISSVANYVSQFPEPVWTVQAAPQIALILMVVAGLVLIFFHTRASLLAVIPLTASLLAWSSAPRPELLVADDARFFGLMRMDQRWLSKPTGHKFLGEVWAGRDGLPYQPDLAFEPMDPQIQGLNYGWRLVFTTTKKGAQIAENECDENTILVAAQLKNVTGDCLFFNEKSLRRMGGMAVDIENGNAIIRANIGDKPVPWGLHRDGKAE